MPPLPVLLAAALATPPLTAARTSAPPEIDGRLDDTAWRAAPVFDRFTQHFPDHGAPPSEPTRVRVLYDDDALYFAIECVQRGAPVVARLTRRDRSIETDSVTVALDTRGDGKGAFVFAVSAAGTLVDWLVYDDSAESYEWDASFRARVAQTPDGWSAEIEVPLRALRFAAEGAPAWKVQVRRHVSARQEDDELAPTPRDASSAVPYFARLEGLTRLESEGGFELRPFVLGRVLRHDRQAVDLAAGWYPRASAGLDMKWHATPDLTLDAAILPDFGQVEADEVVLNLSSYETFFPEKRPFFLEGLDLFSTPLSLFYTRRIGRGVGEPSLPDGDRLVDTSEPAPILAATKLSGDASRGLSIAHVAAVTGESGVLVRRADGREVRRVAEPLAAFQALRTRARLGEGVELGALLTSATRLEPSGTYPLAGITDARGGSLQICPSGDEVPAGDRCTHDAYAAALDVRVRSRSRHYVATAQTVATRIERGPERTLADGTRIGPGDVGAGTVVHVAKEGGGHLRWSASYDLLGRRVDWNDVGYMRRQNRHGGEGSLRWVTTEPVGVVQETSTGGWVYRNHNLDGLTLNGGAGAETSVRFINGVRASLDAGYDERAYNDREIGDGSALERAGTIYVDASASSDPRSDAQLTFSGGIAWGVPRGVSGQATLGVLVRPAPAVEVQVSLRGGHAEGEDRYLEQRPSAYLFGRLRADTLGLTLRSTLTFTPELSLQAYSQAFLSATAWSDFTSAPLGRARRVIDIDDLRAASPPDDFPDGEDGTLNASLILRYEYSLGATLFLVGSHAQSTSGAPGPGAPGALRLRLLEPRGAEEVLLLKASYWWAG
jgi:hypothetical protein